MNNLVQLLQEKYNDIVSEATEAITRAHLRHYEVEDADKIQQRLKKLYDLTLQSVAEKNLVPMIDHVENIARERFAHGYKLYEVQTAFNVLEEAIWQRILNELQPTDYAEALGLVATVLGIGKDTLARAYVSQASKEKAPYIDYKALFEGSESELD